MIISKKKLSSKSIEISEKFFLTKEENSFTYEINNSFIYIEGFLLENEIESIKKTLSKKKKTEDKINEIKEINTKFSGVIFENNKLYVFSDKFSFYKNTFYSFRNNNFIISHNFNDIVKGMNFNLTDVDNDALNEFITLEHTIGKKTFVRGVYYLLVSEVLIYDFGMDKHSIYFKNSYIPKKVITGKMENYFDEMDEILNNATKNIIKRHGNVDYGIGLSGGMDSRVSAHYAKNNNMKLKPFIFGEKGSDAFDISEKLAKTLDIEVKQIEPDLEFFQKYYKKQLEFNPMMNYQYLWYYSVKDDLPKFDILLNGFNGDTAFGVLSFDYKEKAKENNNEKVSKKNILPNIYSSKMLAAPGAMNEMEREFLQFKDLSVDRVRLNYLFRNRLHKMTKENPGMHFLGKYPGEGIFTDNEFTQFMLNTPFNWRKNFNFYHKFIVNKMPELADIRAEREAYPVSEKSEFIKYMKKFCHTMDTQLKMNLFYKKQHKDIYKWMRNRNDFWEFADTLIARNKHKIRVNDDNMEKLIKRFRSGRLFLRTGKQVQPFFLYLSTLVFLDQFED